MNFLWHLIVTFPRFSIIPSNFSQFPLRLVQHVLEFVKPITELCSLVVLLVWPLDVFDIDRFELVVIVSFMMLGLSSSSLILAVRFLITADWSCSNSSFADFRIFSVV